MKALKLVTVLHRLYIHIEYF
jgi:hypothetical protein